MCGKAGGGKRGMRGAGGAGRGAGRRARPAAHRRINGAHQPISYRRCEARKTIRRAKETWPRETDSPTNSWPGINPVGITGVPYTAQNSTWYHTKLGTAPQV